MGKEMQAKPLPVFNLIGIFFGGLWAAGGSLAFSGTIRKVLLISACLVTIALFLRMTRSTQANGSRGTPFHRLPYLVALVLEALGIAIVAVFFPRFGLERYVMQASGVVVGLHFVGLWKATQSIQFLWMAASMCLISGLAMFLQSATNGMEAGYALTGFGNALVLWLGGSLIRR